MLNETTHEITSTSTIDYIVTDFWKIYGDPRVSSLPLINTGPWKVMLISLMYWFFVRVIGPIYMKNREPYDLRTIMLLHNCFLIGLNGMGVIIGLWITDFLRETWNCSRIDYSSTTFYDLVQIYLGYAYFLSKIFDFGDTIFFVLRKKYNQATFLHVFHHGCMPMVAYVGLKFYPSGYSGFLPQINTLIHAVMYTYYAFACSGPQFRKYLTIKKYITQAQLLQFILVFIHAINAIVNPNCHWPLILGYLEAGQSFLFFFMFASFYKHAYIDGAIKKKFDDDKHNISNNNDNNGLHENNNYNHNNNNNDSNGSQKHNKLYSNGVEKALKSD